MANIDRVDYNINNEKYNIRICVSTRSTNWLNLPQDVRDRAINDRYFDFGWTNGEKLHLYREGGSVYVDIPYHENYETGTVLNSICRDIQDNFDARAKELANFQELYYYFTGGSV